MSKYGKIALTALISNAAGFALLLVWQLRRLQPYLQQPAEAARHWGVFFVLLIALLVVLNIMATLFWTGFGKVRGERGFNEVTDERDRLIEGRAIKHFAWVLSAGFIAAMALLALGQELHTAFTVLAIGVGLSGAALHLTNLLCYERGC